MTVKAILRLLPCQPAEAPRFRDAVKKLAQAGAAGTEEQRKNVAAEVAFHLHAQQQMRELNARYFPHVEMTDRERVAKMANRVGLQSPEWSTPPPQQSERPDKTRR